MTITRFAPSPTGMLHIGSARIALVNYLFTKKTGGKFLLRIEDTDKSRSSDAAVDVIFAGLKWLGIDHDGEAVFQAKNLTHHEEAAKKLLESGHAYYCYYTAEELDKQREEAESAGKIYKYDRKWRDYKGEIPKDRKPAIRFKAPLTGKTIVNDAIQGQVEFDNSEIEDFTLLRGDGTPTYMLAVVVDDIMMKVTNIIRGVDHLSNTPKQILLYEALGAKVPNFSHIPLIHGEDGKKLSKRRNSVAVTDYEKAGYLPGAVCHYLATLGWAIEDEFPDQKITLEQAANSFDFSKLSSSAAQFDNKKLNHVNSLWIKNTPVEDLLQLVGEGSESVAACEVVKKRCENLVDLKDMLQIFKEGWKHQFTEEASGLLKEQHVLVKILYDKLLNEFTWDSDFHDKINEFIKANGWKFKDVGPIIRAMLIGTLSSVGISDIVKVIGGDEAKRRIKSLNV